MMKRSRLFLMIPALLAMPSCVQPYVDNETPITFTASKDGTALIAQGVVDDRAPAALQQSLDENPDVKTLILQWVPGSLDDDYNLATGRIIRSYRLTTIVPKNGLVASGGTDLLLAGTDRIISNDACIGVHSWADDENREYGDTTPKEDPVHRSYTDYFKEMGIDDDFYWYSLKAAKADEMHWMTPREQQKFRLASGNSEPEESLKTPEAVQDKCEMRADKLESRSFWPMPRRSIRKFLSARKFALYCGVMFDLLGKIDRFQE